jgi:Arc/MetJ-type ribon-helix-helix transcriptional regulator
LVALHNHQRREHSDDFDSGMKMITLLIPIYYIQRLKAIVKEGVFENQSAGIRFIIQHFIENHDEPRAAATFPPEKERAAAVTIATIPGAKLFHEGQFEGRKVRLPVFLSRRPDERFNPDLRAFYYKLLKMIDTPASRRGSGASVIVRGGPTIKLSQSGCVVLEKRWGAIPPHPGPLHRHARPGMPERDHPGSLGHGRGCPGPRRYRQGQ